MSDRKLPMDRSERLLNELLKIPVNTICCDCGAAGPKWASYNLGCFLCVRCCSVHRKLGTHISKVRSVTLDSWTQEDIETMKTWGNGKVNALYMPHPERHPPPLSMDESAMERYIRSKYEKKEFMEGSNAQAAAPSSRSAYGNTFSGGRGNTNTNVTNSSSYSNQCAQLRDMGFRDYNKNLQVLQSTDGNLDSAIDILVRMGSGPTSGPRDPPPRTSNSPRPSQGRPGQGQRQNSSSNIRSGSSDAKETILWNMGFHDAALNKDALRRAGGNADVAAGILIDEKEKQSRSGQRSPDVLPPKIEPPGRGGNNNSNSNKGGVDLLLDLSDDSEQQQQQQQLQRQQQMQMMMMQQQGFNNNNMGQMGNMSGMNGMNNMGGQDQLQSILDKNASILALYDQQSNQNNNNMFGQQSQQNPFQQQMAQQQQQQQQPFGQFGANNNVGNNPWGTNNSNNMGGMSSMSSMAMNGGMNSNMNSQSPGMFGQGSPNPFGQMGNNNSNSLVDFGGVSSQPFQSSTMSTFSGGMTGSNPGMGMSMTNSTPMTSQAASSAFGNVGMGNNMGGMGNMSGMSGGMNGMNNMNGMGMNQNSNGVNGMNSAFGLNNQGQNMGNNNGAFNNNNQFGGGNNQWGGNNMF